MVGICSQVIGMQHALKFRVVVVCSDSTTYRAISTTDDVLENESRMFGAHAYPWPENILLVNRKESAALECLRS